MKKVLKTTCVLLTVIMIFCSVPHLSVVAEDAGAANSALLYDKAFMGVGERCNFDWLINIDSYYFTVTNTSIADYDETNRSYIIGKAPGTTNVTLTYIEGGVIKYASFQLEVMAQAELPSGTYSIRTCASRYHYAICSSNTTDNLLLCDYETSNYSQMSWFLSSYGDNTYSIFSLTYYSYIGVQQNQLYDNATISFYSASIPPPPLWKILINEGGDFLLIPHTATETNLVVAIPSYPIQVNSPLILANYYEYNNYASDSPVHTKYKTWKLYNDAITINHYFDGSFSSNLISKISTATNFVIAAYNYSLGIPLRSEAAPSYFASSADGCPQGNSQSCNTTTCGTNCDTHHKNKGHLSDQVAAIPHGNNYVSVLWMDRTNTVYCCRDHILGGDAVAQFQDGIPVYNITPHANASLVSNDSNSTPLDKQYEILMGITLAHEITHARGLFEEPYDDTTHCQNPDGTEPYQCCMEPTYMNQKRVQFYNDVLAGRKSIFCPSCLEKVSEYRHAYIPHN